MFLLIKSVKNHPQKQLRKYWNWFFFPYCPELLKQPKQKNVCFKMWLLDQLYIKLGHQTRFWTAMQILQNFGMRISILAKKGDHKSLDIHSILSSWAIGFLAQGQRKTWAHFLYPGQSSTAKLLYLLVQRSNQNYALLYFWPLWYWQEF